MSQLERESKRESAKHTGGRRFVATGGGRALAALVLLAAVAAAGAVHAEGPVHTSRRYWIGKSISQAEKEFGKPTFSEQLLETGGMMVIYAGKNDPVHFVFETTADGRIVRAARVQ